MSLVFATTFFFVFFNLGGGGGYLVTRLSRPILSSKFLNPCHRVMHPKDADSIANSEDPDQTAPLGAV